MTRWTRQGRRAGPRPIIPPLEPLEVPSSAARPTVLALSADPRLKDRPNAEEHDPADRWRKILAVAEALSRERVADEALAASLSYPLAAYDQFRRDVAIRPPPPLTTTRPPMTVLVDAQGAAPFLVRATLRSLQDQSATDWTAQVIAEQDLRERPVASFADTDSRIRFVAPGGIEEVRAGHSVVIDAGTVLDPEALAWFAFALIRTGAKAAFADHDQGVSDPAFRLLRADPLLFGTFDEELLEQGVVPAAIALAGPLPLQGAGGDDARAELLIRAARDGTVAHVPRLLATRLGLPLIARSGREDPAPPDGGELPHEDRSTNRPSRSVSCGERIAVVIPTRDGAGLLARVIETLRSTARQPERLDIVVVDNRSRLAETAALFERLRATGAARVVPFDAAFNWSLASNLGAAASEAPLIAFVNNDVEMLSPGWDDVLAEMLGRPGVGAVGARLLYPDRTIQHAGIAFGFGPGGTEHEGRGVPAAERGPGGRYATNHAVSAVTGAFLAVRRGDFEQLGGFDAARLMIAHSDVDLCLRLREMGKTILYCADIQAIHHEGATRGRNQTQSAIAWDEGERLDLLARWGEALADDPGISPYWRRCDQPFAFLREPTTREILAQIDRSASPDPWRPRRPEMVSELRLDTA